MRMYARGGHSPFLCGDEAMSEEVGNKITDFEQLTYCPSFFS